MTRIGIMQGRLVPSLDGKIQAFPRENWPDEFPLAAAARLDCIEWIYDSASEDVNPLATADGVRHIQELVLQYPVAVRSVCADYFVNKPLVRATATEVVERLEKLGWLLAQCQKLGIQRIVLPFVDQSAILSIDDEETAVGSLRRALVWAQRFGIELHLETNLSPEAFRNFLARLDHPSVKVNYDSGNSASLGYHPIDEFAAYGERIGSVHVKDRRRGRGSVPLGEGDAEFLAVFTGLKHLCYDGDFILQVARGTPGQELTWAKRNRAFVETYFSTVA